MTSEDPRLSRLYDYTKFHIGIYILAGTSMITVLSAGHLSDFLRALIKQPGFLWLAVASMAIAGAAGGIIASTCAVAESFQKVWEAPIGPWGLKWARGSTWATIEHAAFWASIGFFAIAALVTSWPMSVR